MTEQDARAQPAWLSPVAFGGAVAVCFVAATFLMFSTFMYYDDEGYVLISLRNFIQHGDLYRDVYTQYGPFPFVVHYFLDLIGMPLTHTSGRVLTLIMWSGTAVSCAVLAGQATRSLALKVAVLPVAFVHLWVMPSEPTHPGGMIVVLTALAAALGWHAIVTGRITRWAIVAGAITAALSLTKVNVGAFAAFSAGAWWLLHHSSPAVRDRAPIILVLCGGLLPLGLMRPLLETTWVKDFAVVFACSAATTVVAAAMGATGRAGWRELAILVGAAMSVVVIVLGVVLLRGTSVHELIDGIFLAPLRQPTVFSLRYLWPPGILVFTAASTVLCGAAWLARRKGLPGIDGTVAALRLLATAGLAVVVLQFPDLRPDYVVFGFALPCLWLFAWAFAGEEPGARSARTWLALLLLGQCLHVFPVPGSQIAWGSVLVVPLAAVGSWDAVRWFHRHMDGARLPSRGYAVAAVLVFAAVTTWKFAAVASRYREGQYLALPGAGFIRVPDDAASRYQVLTLNAMAHAGMLFSFPGMFSFNLWTNLPTPTLANVTHWFSLLDDKRQRDIIRALADHPRACVIVDHAHIDFLAERGLAPRGLAQDYILQNFEPAFWVDRVGFYVHRGRRIEPFMIGDLLNRSAAAGEGYAEKSLLKLSLLPPRRAIGSIELVLASKDGGRAVLNAHNARVETLLTNSRGEPMGPPRPQEWPLTISGPSVVHVYFNQENHSSLRPGSTIILRDTTGEEVALAWLRP